MCSFGQRDRQCLARLWEVPKRKSMIPAALKKLGKLSDQLDTARESSEATTKEVQHARRATDDVKREVRLQQNPTAAKIKRKRSKVRHAEDGKSQAAVELGRKGGAATAKTRTGRERSALATKAAKTRWNRVQA